MAKNLVYKNDNKKNRVETLAATYDSGRPVISLAGLAAVTVTASGDHTRSEAISGFGTLSGIPDGGVGLTGKEVTLAFDGTWEWPASEITGITAATPQGTAVNFVVATGVLTNAAVAGTTVVPFGYVDFPKDYDKTRGFVPVRIGTR